MSLLNENLEVFLAASEGKSLSETAKQLSMTQSAVTKKIRKLEDSLNVELFDRSKRPIKLTREGEILKHHSLLVKQTLESTTKEIKENSFIHPIFRIGAIESLSKSLLPQLICSMRNEASKIYCTTGVSQSLVYALERRQIDIVFISSALSEVKNLQRYKIFEEPSVLLVPSSFTKNRSQSWTWDKIRLSGLPYLKYSLEGGAGRINDTYLSMLYEGMPSQIEVDSSSTMLALVAKGAGWTIARTLSLIQNPELADSISVLPLPPPAFSRVIYLVARSDENTAQTQHLAKLSRDIFKEELIPQIRKFSPWLDS